MGGGPEGINRETFIACVIYNGMWLPFISSGWMVGNIPNAFMLQKIGAAYVIDPCLESYWANYYRNDVLFHSAAVVKILRVHLEEMR